MSARLFKRGDIWFAWVPRSGGGTRKVSTQCTDRKAAEKRAAELEREALDPAHAAANKAWTVDACDEFLASRERRGRAEGTLHHYRTKLGHVVRLMPARLADVDAAACERFIETRLEEGAAQTTVKKEIRALGATLRHARRSGLYGRDVEATIPELEETYEPRKRFLAPMELVALVNVLPRERAAHVAFIVATGARWSESTRARLADVTGPMVHLRGTKTKKAARTVPVPPTMRLALAWSLANAPGDLFASWSNVRRDLGKVCATLGIAPVTPNDLRRTFGTWLRQSGLTPDLIGNAMGHADGRMAERVYGRIGPADLDKLITERGPALAISVQSTLTDRAGLLMGGGVAESGALATFPETGPDSVSSGNTAKKASKRSAQTRNRTADTGIFNPRAIAANVGESSDSAHTWAANGPTFGARARRWFMREAA